MVDYVRYLLVANERTPSWLARKIGVSHTLVYSWLNGVRTINEKHFEKTVKVFGLTLEQAKKRIEESKLLINRI